MATLHGKVGAVYLGQAYTVHCDIASSSITVPHNSDIDFDADDNFTLEMWAHINATGDRGEPLLIKEASNGYSLATATGGKLQWLTTDSPDDNSWSTTTTFASDTLHHVVIVRNASTRSDYIYVDGEKDVVFAYTYNAQDLRNTSDLYIVGFTNASLYLHQLRIFRTAVTDAHVSDMFKGKKVARDNCVLDLRCGNGRGTTIYDLSGKAHDGTLANVSMWDTSHASSDVLVCALGFYNWSLSYEADDHDCTEFGGAVASVPYPKEFIPGLTNWTVTAERYWKSPDYAYRVGNEVFVRLYWDESSENRYEGWGIITGVSVNTPVDDLVTETISIRGKKNLAVVTS